MKQPNKFKTGFVRSVREEEAAAAEQRALKKKNGVPEDAEVLVVEKTNMAKFTVNTLKGLVRVTATVILLLLAAVGLICLIYPDTRQSLYTIVVDVKEQIQALLGA